MVNRRDGEQTGPFDLEELDRARKIVKDVERELHWSNGCKEHSYAIGMHVIFHVSDNTDRVLARLMFKFGDGLLTDCLFFGAYVRSARNRSFYNYGTPQARLTRTQRVRDIPTHGMIFACFNFFTFGYANHNRTQLEDALVEDVAVIEKWNRTIDAFSSQWRNTVIM